MHKEDEMYKLALCSCAALIAFTAGAIAQAQISDVPNLASAEFGWQPVGGGFRPVEGKPGPTARSGVSKDGERLADENNPNLTAWAASIVKTHNDLVRNGHRAFAAQSRCWPGGTPGQLLFVAQPVYFIQTPSEVWMIWERDHQVRRVYLNREHSADATPGWFGESVGHYENGELVIDTRGFVEHPLSFVDNMTTPHTKNLHVVERWKITDGGKGLQATVTVDDPAAFKAPWSAVVRWRKQEKTFAETSCAENNLGYERFFERDEYPMPIAKTLDF
jgi:hypothetical protein